MTYAGEALWECVGGRLTTLFNHPWRMIAVMVLTVCDFGGPRGEGNLGTEAFRRCVCGADYASRDGTH